MRDKGSGWRRRRSCRFIWPDMRWLRHRAGSGVQILHRKLEHEALLYALFVYLLHSCPCFGCRDAGQRQQALLVMLLHHQPLVLRRDYLRVHGFC